MQSRDVGFALFGGAAIYLAMAACSAADGDQLRGENAMGHGGSFQGQGGSGVIPEAEAATNGSRLKVRYYAGEDGSKQFAAWWDSERNEECQFGMAQDGQMRCQPAPDAYHYSSYSDPGCTQPLATALDDCRGTPHYGFLSKPGCERAVLFKVIGAYTGTVYSPTSGGCSEVTDATDTFYSVQEVPPSSFVAASVQNEN